MLFSRRISAKQLGMMCRRIGSSVEAGLDILAILERESRTGSNSHQAKMAEIRTAIASGDSFADAIAKQGQYFPKQFQLMVDVGEKTGRLELVLLKLAEFYERMHTMKGIFLAAIIWPGIQLVVALGVIGLVIVLPQWLLGQDTDILGFGLVGTRGLAIYVLVIMGIGGGFAVLLAAVRRGFLARPFSELVMKTPGLGVAFRTMAQLRFSRSLGLAIESGMDAWNSVGLAFQSAQTPFYVQHAEACKRAVRAGAEIHRTLKATGVFDQTLIDAVQVGEDSGRLAESLEIHAKQLDDRMNVAFKSMAVMAGIGVWIIVAAFIIFMIFRIAMFYLGLIDDVLNNF